MHTKCAILVNICTFIELFTLAYQIASSTAKWMIQYQPYKLLSLGKVSMCWYTMNIAINHWNVHVFTYCKVITFSQHALWIRISSCIHSLGFLGGSVVKIRLPMQETWVWPLGQEDPHGEGNRNLLQYSCLKNPMNREVWSSYSPLGSQKSRTWLSN